MLTLSSFVIVYLSSQSSTIYQNYSTTELLLPFRRKSSLDFRIAYAIENIPIEQSMSGSDSLTYRSATESDFDTLTTLVNNSYRGVIALKGWGNENESVEVSRTNPDDLSKMIATPGSVILVFFGETDSVIKGCIYLRHQPEVRTAYFGMITVRPDLQRNGYGKFILSVAENYVKSQWNVDFIEMLVLEERPELIAYYNRHDYTDTGRRETFPAFEGVQPLRPNLQLCILQKRVKEPSE